MNISRIPDNYLIVKDYSSVKPTSSDNSSYIKTTKLYSTILEIENDFPNHIPKQVAHIKNMLLTLIQMIWVIFFESIFIQKHILNIVLFLENS